MTENNNNSPKKFLLTSSGKYTISFIGNFNPANGDDFEIYDEANKDITPNRNYDDTTSILYIDDLMVQSGSIISIFINSADISKKGYINYIGNVKKISDSKYQINGNCSFNLAIEDAPYVYYENGKYTIEDGETLFDFAMRNNLLVGTETMSNKRASDVTSFSHIFVSSETNYYPYSPCGYIDSSEELINGEMIYENTDSTLFDNYIKNDMTNFLLNHEPSEERNTSFIFCDGHDGISYIYKLPYNIAEIWEPTFKRFYNNNLTVLLTPICFKKIDNSFVNVLGGIENIKIPYTLTEISELLQDETYKTAIIKIFNISYVNNNYSGTFEFSDGTKKTLAELYALFS